MTTDFTKKMDKDNSDKVQGTTPNELTDKEDEDDVSEDKLACPSPETITAYLTVPPDGGWGWVIVGASFFCNMVVDGIVFSFGTLLEHIALDFGVSSSKATIAGSLLSGFYLLSGPFVSALANRYGLRFTGILGSVFAGIMFAMATLVPSIELLWVFYGVMGGIGFGMIYVPAVVTTGFYFEKWRALATGISVTGSGIGTILMGPITTALIEKFSWRGAVLVQGGFIISCSIGAALYRPLKPIQVSVQKEKEELGEEAGHLPLLQRIKLAREQLKRADSTISIDVDVGITAVEPTEKSKFLRSNNNAAYPTAAEVLHGHHGSHQSLVKSKESLVTRENLRNILKSEKRMSIPLYSDILLSEKREADEYDPLKEVLCEDDPNEHLHDDVFYIPKKSSKTAHAILGSDVRRDSITIKYRSRASSEASYYKSSRRRSTMDRKSDAGVRPFYRDDICLHGSLKRIPQFQSHGSGLDYTMSVTRLPTWKDVQEEENDECVLCPEAVRRTLATMLDVSLLKSPSFMIFAISGFVGMMGIFVPFVYLASRVQTWGWEKNEAILLVASIGITNTLGRVICGALSSVPGVSAMIIYNIAMTMGGLATMFSGYSRAKSFQYMFTGIFGFATACFGSLRSIIAVDLMGIDRLTNAFGLLLLFQGLASVIGSPIAGMFYDLTNSYDISFYLSGGLLFLSGFMCFPLGYINAWEKRKSEDDKKESGSDTSPPSDGTVEASNA